MHGIEQINPLLNIMLISWFAFNEFVCVSEILPLHFCGFHLRYDDTRNVDTPWIL